MSLKKIETLLKNKKILPWLIPLSVIFAIFCGGLLGAIILKISGRESGIIHSVVEHLVSPESIFRKLNQIEIEKESKLTDWEKISEDMERALAKDSGIWAIVISGIDDKNPLITINKDQVFTAASTMKLLVAEYAWLKIDKQEINIDTIIGGLSLEKHMERMVNRSNNDSWYALSNFFTYKNLQVHANETGLEMTNTYKNTTTAGDMDTLLKNIFRGKNISQEGKQAILKLMQKTETEDRITPNLPQNFELWHKTGTWEGAIHDIAIIKTPQEEIYTLVILSQSSPQPYTIFKEITTIFCNAFDEKK